MESRQVPIPPRELLAVAHPCHVRNAKRAIHMLGGERTLAHADGDASNYLECHLRPDDPLSHPLFGVRVDSPAVLVRVKRPRGSPHVSDSLQSARGGASSFDIMAVGVVRQSYRFEGLADFQYVTSSELCAALSSTPQAPAQSWKALDPMPAVQAVAPIGTRAAEPHRHGELEHGLQQRSPKEDSLEARLASHTLRIPPALFCSVDAPIDFIARPVGCTLGEGPTGVNPFNPSLREQPAQLVHQGLVVVKKTRKRRPNGTAQPSHGPHGWQRPSRGHAAHL